jgi:pimeloyl-ACP methyl ester carboxylesterase
MTFPVTRMRFDVDGITLAVESHGDPAATTSVVLLHGGGQTRGAWSATAKHLAARGSHAVAIDLRGHGDSDWSPDGRYPIDRFASDVRAVVAQMDGRGQLILVGASLGGLASLLAVGEEPQADVRALVLVDVAHRPEPLGVTRIVAFMSAHPNGFASIEEAANAVAAYLPQRDSSLGRVDGLKKNLREKNGRWVWHWDPRLTEPFDPEHPERAPLPSPERCVAAARAFGRPILLVRGTISDVLSPTIAREFCEAVPTARWVDVAGAGHMIAGDRNDRFLESILPFLDRVAA